MSGYEASRRVTRPAAGVNPGHYHEVLEGGGDLHNFSPTRIFMRADRLNGELN